MYAYEQITVDGTVYWLQVFCQRNTSHVIQLNIERDGSTCGWWTKDSRGRVRSNVAAAVPSRLADGCKLWMATDGYQDISPKEFLTSLGVLR